MHAEPMTCLSAHCSNTVDGNVHSYVDSALLAGGSQDFWAVLRRLHIYSNLESLRLYVTMVYQIEISVSVFKRGSEFK